MKDSKGHGSNAHQQGINALGRTVKVVGYHGTASQFESLEPRQPYIKLANRTQEPGIYFTTDPRVAFTYAAKAAREGRGVDRRVIQGEITMRNPLDITDLIKSGQKSGLNFGDAKDKAMGHLTPEHDGVIFRGDQVNPPEYMARSGHQIRTINVTSFRSKGK